MNIDSLVGLINLFFAPMLTIYLYYRKHGRSIRPSLELLFQYGISTIFIVLIAKAIAFLPFKLMNKELSVSSVYYTIAALVAAWILAVLIRLSKNISMELKYARNEGAADKHEASE